MWERGCFSTTILAQPRRPCRPRHPFAAPRTSLPCVCTRRRNCIEQLSPSPEYALRTVRFPVDNHAAIKLTHDPFWRSWVSLKRWFRCPGHSVELLQRSNSGHHYASRIRSPDERRVTTSTSRSTRSAAVQIIDPFKQSFLLYF